jgi:uncharacterized protein (TIGR02757 family)
MTALDQFLTKAETTYHHKEFLSFDPLELVHSYTNPWDQEAIALIAGVLAYGNVKQIKKSVQDAISRIHRLAESPQVFVQQLNQTLFRKKALQAFQNYVHRFNQGSDLIHLLQLLQSSWTRYGSLGGHFLTYLNPKDETIETALNLLIKDWRFQLKPLGVEPTFSYLLTAPEDGSCCKRWCMILRWMGRKDALDLGLWMKTSPLQSTFPAGRALESRQLVMPLDTHTGRLSQTLGLTQKKSLNWKVALEVTQRLKTLDPLDPTRFDFALTRLGMIEGSHKQQVNA